MNAFLSDLGLHVRGSFRQLRAVVAGLDDEAVAWSPGPEMNSVAVIVTHMLGSHAEVVDLVRGLESRRDRDAEFRAEATAKDLLGMIDEADARLDEHLSAITEDDLARRWLKASAPHIKAPQSGLFWLLGVYGHLREHIAHIEMTLQVYRARV